MEIIKLSDCLHNTSKVSLPTHTKVEFKVLQFTLLLNYLICFVSPITFLSTCLTLDRHMSLFLLLSSVQTGVMASRYHAASKSRDQAQPVSLCCTAHTHSPSVHRHHSRRGSRQHPQPPQYWRRSANSSCSSSRRGSSLIAKFFSQQKSQYIQQTPVHLVLLMSIGFTFQTFVSNPQIYPRQGWSRTSRQVKSE